MKYRSHLQFDMKPPVGSPLKSNDTSMYFPWKNTLHIENVYLINILTRSNNMIIDLSSIIKLWLAIINSLSTYKTRGVIVDASSGIPKRCECKNRKINAAKVWKHQRVYANFRTRFVHAWMINNNKQLQLITYSASRIEWINYQEYLVDYWGMV